MKRTMVTWPPETKPPTAREGAAGASLSVRDSQEAFCTDHDVPAIRKWTVSADLLVEILV